MPERCIARTGDVETCLRLRRTVFIEEQNVPEYEELDGRDGEALHILATQNGPAGCARVLIADGVAKIGRVCVLPAHRGRGIGAELVRACVDLAAQQGAARAVLGAQVHAIAFYEGLGFTAVGDVYDDAGIPHRDMVRAL